MYDRFTRLLKRDTKMIRDQAKLGGNPTDHSLVTLETVLRGNLRSDAEHLGFSLENLYLQISKVRGHVQEGQAEAALEELKSMSQKVRNLQSFLM